MRFFGRLSTVLQFGFVGLLLSGMARTNADTGLQRAGTYTDVLSGVEQPFLWRASIGHHSGRPIVQAGKILIGTNNSRPRDPDIQGDYGVVMCFSTDGEFLWQVAHSKLPHRANDLPGLGIQSRPFIDGERAFYVSNRGELICLDLKESRNTENDAPHRDERKRGFEYPDIAWTLDMVRELGIFKRDAFDIGNPVSSPLVVGDKVYCVTGNGSSFGLKLHSLDARLVPFPDAPSFIAVDKTSGRVIWSSSQPGDEIMYGQWGSAAFGYFSSVPQVIFPGGDGRLYGFEPNTGQLLWQFDCNEPHATKWTRQSRGTRQFILSAPIVDKTTIYVGVNLDLEHPRVGPRPIYAIAMEGGKPKGLKWKFTNEDFDGTFGEVAVKEGVLYTLSGDGVLFALDSDTGRELWHADLNESACYFGSPYIYNGVVYVATADDVFAFAEGRQKNLMNRYQLDGGIQSTPVAFDNTLLVATSKHLCAIPLAGGPDAPASGSRSDKRLGF